MVAARAAAIALLATGAWIQACGSPPSVSESDASADSAADTPVDTHVGPSPAYAAAYAEVCEAVEKRIHACGLHYSYESFPTDCAAWAAGDGGPPLDEIQACSIKPCKSLLACLAGAL